MTSVAETSRQQSFARYAWIVLAFNLFVIVWGGFVSASGSGDGCGTDWPYCSNLASAEIESATLVEFFHRATSGLALLAVLVLLVLSRRRFPKGHSVRKAAAWSMFFMVTESLLGAGLVIFAWVDTNESLARAFVQPLHMVNTFLLSGAVALTAWWASGYPGLSLRANRGRAVKLGLFLGGVMLLSAFGSIASLASTLFPSDTFIAGVQQDFAEDVHYLIRLRVLHPLLATLVGLYFVYLYNNLRSMPLSTVMRRLLPLVLVLFWVQYVIGAANAVLLAPIWLQMTHLLMTHLFWILAVLLAAGLLVTPVSSATGRLAREPVALKPQIE